MPGANDILSDEEMLGQTSDHKEVLSDDEMLGPVPKKSTLIHGIPRKEDLPKPMMPQPLPDLETISDWMDQGSEGMLGAGVAKKAGFATNAAIDKLIENSKQIFNKDEPEVSFGDRYAKEVEKDLHRQKIRDERSPRGAVIAPVVGALSGPNFATKPLEQGAKWLPKAINAAKGSATRVGVNTADAATRAESWEDLKHNAKWAGGLSTAAETLPYVGKGVSAAARKTGDLGGAFIEMATGATGKQVQKFDKGAGRRMAEEGIAGWFSSPAGIAKRTEANMQKAFGEIDSALKELDAQGVKVNRGDVVNEIDKKISELSFNEAESDTVRKLEQIKKDILLKDPELPISQAETVKRSYADKVNYDPYSPSYNSADNMSNATAAEGYRGQVEERALEANPDLAKLLQRGKEAYGFNAPIKEASQKRANVLRQQAIGGLLDVGAFTGGALSGDNSEGGFARGVAAAAARRSLGKRFPSFAGKSLLSVEKVMEKIGSMPIKYQKLLQGSPEQIAMTHFILQKDDPEYRRAIGEGE